MCGQTAFSVTICGGTKTEKHGLDIMMLGYMGSYGENFAQCVSQQEHCIDQLQLVDEYCYLDL